MVVCCEHYMLGDIVCPEPYYYCVWEGGKNCDDAVYVSEVCRMEGWLIGVITTVCALVLCACIGCIYCCCFRRPRAKQSVIVVGGAGAAAASASANTTTVIDTAPLLQHTPTQGYGGYSYGQPADTKSPPGYNYVDTYGSGSYSAY